MPSERVSTHSTAKPWRPRSRCQARAREVVHVGRDHRPPARAQRPEPPARRRRAAPGRARPRAAADPRRGPARRPASGRCSSTSAITTASKAVERGRSASSSVVDCTEARAARARTARRSPTARRLGPRQPRARPRRGGSRPSSPGRRAPGRPRGARSRPAPAGRRGPLARLLVEVGALARPPRRPPRARTSAGNSRHLDVAADVAPDQIGRRGAEGGGVGHQRLAGAGTRPRDGGAGPAPRTPRTRSQVPAVQLAQAPTHPAELRNARRMTRGSAPRASPATRGR